LSLEAGQTLFHYRLIEPLGEGGMGVVWTALDTSLDREVAIYPNKFPIKESLQCLDRYLGRVDLGGS
jgi:hypothetical protein